MLLPEIVTAGLSARGEIWESVSGSIGMRGPLLRLRDSVSALLRGFSLEATDDEWRMPQAVAFETLERASYFDSFPQWLTAASHLGGDELALRRIAGSSTPGLEASRSLQPASAALPPAVCYHTYAAMQGRTIASPLVMTAEETCWRHEGERTALLERGWAFTMREIVCIAKADDAEEFRQREMQRSLELAAGLGLQARVEVATDPFFAPTARGKALLQKVKSLKHELLIDYPDGRSLAIASFNNHERFFGDAFAISIDGNGRATSACVAFGLERWMLAILMTHGLDHEAWDDIVSCQAGAL